MHDTVQTKPKPLEKGEHQAPISNSRRQKRSRRGAGLKRTVILHSLELNTGKLKDISQLISAYANQKDAFLVTYAHIKFLDALLSNRLRDSLVASGFKSPFGLKARAWKLALNDALQAIDVYWQAIIYVCKKYIFRKFSDEAERHYAFWTLKDYKRIQSLMSGQIPDGEPLKSKLDLSARQKIAKYLHRRLRKEVGSRPRVCLRRSICLDARMYRVFDEKGTQYISITKLFERGRVVIPLKGRHTISGNIRIVLNRITQTIEVHTTSDVLRKSLRTNSPDIGVDLGVSELFTDSEGIKWCSEYWDELKSYAEKVNATGKQRNKLHALEKSLRRRNPNKARRIRKFNLGKDKMMAKKSQFHSRIKTDVNTAINRFLDVRMPHRIAIEDLRGYSPEPGKGWFSRLLSFWTLGIINQRFTFKSQAGGSSLESVNAAYSSQTCPACGYLDPLNRKRDRFQCLNCGTVLDADTAASRNLKARLDDPDIQLWTSTKRVREILVQRFEKRRLEGLVVETQADTAGLTVSGKTPGTIMTEVRREWSTGERNFGVWV
jgi:transposase